MSNRSSFRPTKEEPVKLGQVWEYGELYHRQGRFAVKTRVRADFWECVETSRGEIRRYTTDDILNHAHPTRIQPGQIWEDDYKAVRTIVRHLVDPFSDAWEVAVSIKGARTTVQVSDYKIRTDWTLVVGVGGGGASCPLCGGSGYQGFNMFECSNGSCRNYRAPKA